VLAVGFGSLGARMAAQEADSAEHNRALRLLARIPMPQMSGTWDHLSADPATSRLFLSAQDDHAVDVVDLATERPILRIVGSFNRPQGECYVPGLNKLVITNGRDGTCRIISGTTYRVLDSVQLSLGADMIEFDPRTRYLYIDHGGNDSKRGPGMLAIVDAVSDKLVGNIGTDFRPAAMALEKSGPRIYVILPGKNQVAVIDRTTRRIVDRFPVGGRPASMTFDEGHRRLFVPSRTIPGKNPGQHLFVIDADSGKTVATVPCMDGIESMFYDAALRRLYVTGLEGFAEIYQQADPDTYTSIARIPTGPGAGTSQFIPELNRYCVALSPQDKQVSQIWVFEPIP
jgi:YVTN family beta-propeller protein